MGEIKDWETKDWGIKIEIRIKDKGINNKTKRLSNEGFQLKGMQNEGFRMIGLRNVELWIRNRGIKNK